MESIRKYAAGSAIIAMLLSASPALAFADSGSKSDDHRGGLGLGVFVKSIIGINGEHHDNKGHDKNESKSSASRTDAISGTFTSLSGATITLTSKDGALYTVTTASTTINGSTDVAGQLAKFQIGDKLQVKGSIQGNVVTAARIKNQSLVSREALTRFNGVRVGSVSTIDGSTITINRSGTSTTTVFTNASTFFVAGGSATSSAAVHVGSQLLVFGPSATSSSSDSITASVVVIFDSGMKFLKHFFHR